MCIIKKMFNKNEISFLISLICFFLLKEKREYEMKANVSLVS